MEIKIYKTSEISNQLWEQLVKGFNVAFEGHNIDKQSLCNMYVSNIYGYSYHAVPFDGDIVAGFLSIIPHEYIINKEFCKLGLGSSIFILPQYRRDITLFRNMYVALKKYCAKDGVSSFLGVANPNAHLYSVKILRCKELFYLPYHIIPVNIFNVLKRGKFKYLNFLTKLYLYPVLGFSYIFSLLANFKEKKRGNRMNFNAKFLETRFKSDNYKTIKKGKTSFTYVVVDEEGINAAYIMDFREEERKTFSSLLKSVVHIISHEKIDIIMYVGTLNVKQTLLTKVPFKFEPKHLPLTYNILEGNKEKLINIDKPNEWDFSLLNLDVR